VLVLEVVRMGVLGLGRLCHEGFNSDLGVFHQFVADLFSHDPKVLSVAHPTPSIHLRCAASSGCYFRIEGMGRMKMQHNES